MAEETMKDFEQEIEASLENMKTYDDPDAGKWEVFQKMADEKQINKVKITEVVKGGCIAFLDEVRGFIPASQLSTKYVENLDEYLGKSLEVVVITVEPAKKRLVLSHKELEKAAEVEKKAKRVASVKVGDELEGKVESIKDYGVFVDLGEGVSGLLHVSQMSHTRIKHPSVVCKVGDSIKVKVIEIKDGKLSLSKKVLEMPVEEKDPSNGFKYEEKGSASTSLAGLLKNIKL